MKIRELLEDVSIGGTGTGSIASAEAPLGPVIKRTENTNTSKRKYANTVNTAKYTKADAEDK